MDDCFFSCFLENQAICQYDNGNERARKAGIDKNRNTVHNSRKQGTHAEKLDITASKCTKAVNRYEKQKRKPLLPKIPLPVPIQPSVSHR